MMSTDSVYMGVDSVSRADSALRRQWRADEPQALCLQLRKTRGCYMVLVHCVSHKIVCHTNKKNFLQALVNLEN